MQKPEMFHQIVLKVGYLSIINFRYAVIQNHILIRQDYTLFRNIVHNLKFTADSQIVLVGIGI